MPTDPAVLQLKIKQRCKFFFKKEKEKFGGIKKKPTSLQRKKIKNTKHALAK